jgi:hypothetical protein
MDDWVLFPEWKVIYAISVGSWFLMLIIETDGVTRRQLRLRACLIVSRVRVRRADLGCAI